MIYSLLEWTNTMNWNSGGVYNAIRIITHNPHMVYFSDQIYHHYKSTVVGSGVCNISLTMESLTILFISTKNIFPRQGIIHLRLPFNTRS